MHSLEWVCFGAYFPRFSATQKINIKIAFSWAQKQFVTPAHALFPIDSIMISVPPDPIPITGGYRTTGIMFRDFRSFPLRILCKQIKSIK